MLERPEGDGFAKYYATADFAHMVRWILHGADATVAAVALPSTCARESYLAEKAKGKVAILPPGETRGFMALFGYVTPGEATCWPVPLPLSAAPRKELYNG